MDVSTVNNQKLQWEYAAAGGGLETIRSGPA
jgi:hypothetical protein